ncbi:uncharacterized protein [Porites lutea]|uniref:uncharacterized protein n=1 Tax=Porites lutea TaxID=51062 RepID=UPI003CC58C47
MSQFSCSFAVHCTSECDVSTRYPDRTQFFPLNSCVSDVRAHLRELQTTQSCVASERELILARVGLFDEEGKDMVICPKHRVLLGAKYCPSRKCQHPLHGRRKGKVSRGVNLKMSKEIKETWDVLVPVGSGVCRQCRGDHLRTLGSTDADSEVQDPGLASTSHPEPQIHEPSCSTESAEEIVEPPQLLPPATEESEQLSATPVLHVRFQEDLISEHSDRDSDPSDRHSDALSRTSSGSQESLGAAETSAEWQPTPQIQHRLYYLNNFLRMATEGRVSPVRSQCQCDVLTMSSRTQRYYRKKAEQAIEGVLESIAPGNASWLYHQVMQRRIRLQAAEGIVEDTLAARLVILYEEAANWYTRQQILSLFVNDYSKSELLALIPGLSKWRIDEARKHAFQTKPGQPIDPPRITRCLHQFFKMWHMAPELLNWRVERA